VLSQPTYLALDAAGNLYVADSSNNRVLRFPADGTTTAVQVLGQPDFISASPGATPTTLNYPQGIVVDNAGNLYVSDTYNSRVLAYSASTANGPSAVAVFGQMDMISGSTNAGGGMSASSLRYPGGLSLDAQGNLLVTDINNIACSSCRRFQPQRPWPLHSAYTDRAEQHTVYMSPSSPPA